MSIYNITPKERRKLNKELRVVLKETYFESIPLDTIFKVAQDQEIELVQEDNTPWDGFLCGDNSDCFFRMGRKITEANINGVIVYDLIRNSGLQLSWYKMESGRYEVTGYFT